MCLQTHTLIPSHLDIALKGLRARKVRMDRNAARLPLLFVKLPITAAIDI